MQKNDSKNTIITQQEPSSMDFIEDYNVYNDLNAYYVNSYDLDTDITAINKKNKPKGKLHVVSNYDEIQFIHNDDVSERHKQIHKNTSSKSKTSATKSSSATSKKTIDDKFAEKKKELRNRMEEKKRIQQAKEATASTNRTYNADQLKSQDIVETTVSKKQTKKKSSGIILAIILAIFGIIPSCSDSLENLIYDSSYEDNIEYYQGEVEDLHEVYEVDDTEKNYPYYYDDYGNIYYSDYEFTGVDDPTHYNFSKSDTARIYYLSIKHEWEDADNYIDTFIDETTYEVYYIIAGSFYNVYDEPVDSSKLNIPLETIKKINEYNQ